MPTLMQGNIFDAAAHHELAIVFGHIGFNEFTSRWRDFAVQHTVLRDLDDPFKIASSRAIEWTPGRWLWFVPADDNNGLDLASLTDALEQAEAWAIQFGVASLVTNGVGDTGHSHDTMANRRSDDQRAAFLTAHYGLFELKHDIAVELISLNDVYLRRLAAG